MSEANAGEIVKKQEFLDNSSGILLKKNASFLYTMEAFCRHGFGGLLLLYAFAAVNVYALSRYVSALIRT